MLRAIGVGSVEELYGTIPPELRLKRPLNLPAPFASEHELRRHVTGLLADTMPAGRTVSFLGAGTYQHDVPEICREVAHRAEFLTDYAGEPYEDHGRWQALFEYTSLMAELLEMDVVSIPTYDGFQAAATALRMSVRLTGRRVVLLPQVLNPRKRARLEAFLDGFAQVEQVPCDPATGTADLDALGQLLDKQVAGVYVETPNAVGAIETQLDAIAHLAHRQGAVLVAGTEPLALGYLTPPARQGADIVCGDLQALGLGLAFGGARGGFIAVHDEPQFVFELPTRLFGLAPTTHADEIGFADVAYERTSLARREEGVEWVGTAAALSGITAAVYLSLLGPDGLAELGEAVAALTAYTMDQLAAIPGVEVPFGAAPHWREFAVRYRAPVATVNRLLRHHGITGGSGPEEVPALGGNASLLAVTEVHSKADIDLLASALRGVMA
jgi:glycine dehydrogenase subunit 1